MKATLILTLLLFLLPVWLVDFSKDNLILYASLCTYSPDFDGDNLQDLSVWDPKSNTLYFQLSSGNEFYKKKFFESSLKFTPVFADYDGDKKTDFGFFQDEVGQWILHLTTNSTSPLKTFLGNVVDEPLPVDLEGTRQYDIAVRRSPNGAWVLPIRDEKGKRNPTIHYQGYCDDIPGVGDFDGDKKSDLLIWRSKDSYWYIDKSTTNYNPNAGEAHRQGQEWDVPVLNDYDGDLRCDLTLWRPQNQTWYFLFAGSQKEQQVKFGSKGDIPLSLDLNGDLIPELVTWNMSKKSWNILNLKNGETKSITWSVPSSCLPASCVLQKYE